MFCLQVHSPRHAQACSQDGSEGLIYRTVLSYLLRLKRFAIAPVH